MVAPSRRLDFLDCHSGAGRVIHARVRIERPAFVLDVDLRTEEREGNCITGVFGASGAGKTTLLHAIAGLRRPDRGEITVGGTAVFDSAKRIDVPPHRRGVGVVFQEPRLFPHRSVRGNLFYGRPRGPRSTAEFDAIVDRLEVRPLLDRGTEGLSGGEQQRVALARTLLSRPRALLLDEPLASLDIRLRHAALGLIARTLAAANLPALYVSHDLGEILRLTDRLAIIDRGRLVASGPYTGLLHDAAAWSVLRDRGAVNVLPAVLLRHDPVEGLSVVRVGIRPGDDQEFVCPAVEGAPGSPVSLSVPPWDVALAAGRVESVSIQNQVRGTVTRITNHPRGVLVEVDVGTPLFAEISGRAAATMGLRAGSPVVCLIKTQSICANAGTAPG